VECSGSYSPSTELTESPAKLTGGSRSERERQNPSRRVDPRSYAVGNPMCDRAGFSRSSSSEQANRAGEHFGGRSLLVVERIQQ
jgi:hypothetical protein